MPQRSSSVVRLLAIPGLVLALVIAASGCVIQTPALSVSVVLGGLDHPWDIAFTPDGRTLFTERSGNIAVESGGSKVVLAHPSDVDVFNESGMMGIAVDPNFATNRRIYTCFTSLLSGPSDLRVVRWVVNPTYTALTNRTDILTGGPVFWGRHAGCRTRFGPDGYLWVTMGDAATNTTPQDPTSLGGKVLRITTDGAGAPGNPGGALRPEIYTYGHRNPQGVAFRPSDGTPFEIEHGTDRNDEVNVLVAGGNYGWDPKPPGGGSLYDESQPMTDLVKFPNARQPVWWSGEDGTIAPSGGTFITGAQWGPWDGKLAMAVLKGQQLRLLSFDGTNKLDAMGTAITDRGRLRVAVQHADGSLWLATDANPGSLLRVTPA